MNRSSRFKILLLTLVVILAIGQLGNAQSTTTLYLKVDPGNSTQRVIIVKEGPNEKVLQAADLKKVNYDRGLKIDRSGLQANDVVKLEAIDGANTATDITANNSFIDISIASIYKIKTKDSKTAYLNITITPNHAAAIHFIEVGKDYTNKEDNNDNATYSDWREYARISSGSRLSIIQGTRRYFPSSNKAYICLDPYGNIIGRKPVNLDQDDEIIFLIVVPNTKAYDTYQVDDNDAEYAPSDLSFRPFDNPTAQSKKDEDALPYTVKEIVKGPYTSSNVTFTVRGNGKTINSFTVHINPLYHLGVGVSYVSSSLDAPSFNVSKLTDTSNTITQSGQTARTFLTLNVVWYWWETFKYFKKGDPLTRGRDVLKEPDFLHRLNPTFGISLKGKLEENFFAGFTFEFARGGSICAGWHYGRIDQLTDHKFTIGETVFKGVQSDVKTESVWAWGQFVGITIDTRIFNRLLSARSGAGSAN